MIIDISIPVNHKTPIWPKTPRLRLKNICSIKKGDSANDTKIEMSLHTGTHLDAPRHFFSGGQSIDKMPLQIFIGPAFVAYLPKVKKITAYDLEKLHLPRGVSRLLFRTSNSLLWKKRISKFQKNYVGLTADAAMWLSKRKIKLVGVDYLSVSAFDETVPVHRILLKKGIALLEGINLGGVKQGVYQLICFPVKISNLEAAPVRAVLIKNK
ncbi:MAG: cyclase family protein [bacterium]|nr:cyclase family protein [bacterium]